MAETTHISWADATFNPWIGCTKVSPACDGCYAEHLMANRHKRVQWGKPGQKATYSRTGESYWQQPRKWNRKAIAKSTRPFVFCASLADVFDNQVDPAWRADLFQLIRETPALVWLLLTKRPQNIMVMVDEAGGLPPNVALGTTIEDQKRATMNGLNLLNAGSYLKPLFLFYSCEPLLEAIRPPLKLRNATIGWIITGGGTDQGSHKARPTHQDAFRRLRDQSAEHGIPFHHKQWGEWLPQEQFPPLGPGEFMLMDCPGYSFGSTDLAADQCWKIGKKNTGRLIDGVLHDARPEVPAL